MNKENNRSAAGLRRSAIAERIRLREEWSALKEVDTATTSRQKKPVNPRCTPSVSSRKKQPTAASSRKKKATKPMDVGRDALLGVVALVDVGAEARALPLRCALAAMGASVVIEWSPLVTHLIWTDSGSRATRAKARALACKLVSPLWVEACAASNSKLSERTFPAASRQSDLPSPRTLRQLLKRAEAENVPLIDLLSDSKEDETGGRPRLRISSGTDTSTDKTTDTSADTIDAQSRINTASRRAMASPAIREPPKSRRKLFTHKEAEDISSSDEDADVTKNNKNKNQSKLTQREKKDLARAERMAKKLLAACNTQRSHNNNNVAILSTQNHLKPKIVLTGMTRLERQAITKHIQHLNGIIQKKVNKRTTHVLLGPCRTLSYGNRSTNISGVTSHGDLSTISWEDATDKRARTCNALQGSVRGCRVLHARWAIESAAAGKWLHHNGYEVEHLKKICQKARVERAALGRLNSEYAYDVFYGMRVRLQPTAEQREAAMQLLTLCGAIVENNGQTNLGQTCKKTQNVQQNCLQTQNVRQNCLQTQNFGQNYLQIQNVEQNCLQTQNVGQNYLQSQNVGQNGLQSQNGGQNGRQTALNARYDVIIGSGVGEVNSKWVFDSVAAGRMRTTRRYINMNSCTDINDDN